MKSICKICEKEFKLNQLQRHIVRSHQEINPEQYYLDNLFTGATSDLECPIKSEDCKGKRLWDSITYGYSPTCGCKKCSTKWSAQNLKKSNLNLLDIIFDISYLKSFILNKVETVNLKGIQKHIKSKNLEEYKQIIKATEDILGSSEEVNFSERLYQIVNGLPGRLNCPKLVDSCTGILKFKNYKEGYQEYCEKCYTKSSSFSKVMSEVQQNRSDEDEEKRRSKISITKLGKSNDEKEIITNKMKGTVINRFGEMGLRNGSIKEKKIQTSLERYGTKHPKQNNTVKQTCKSNLVEKYGVDSWMKTVEAKVEFNKIWKDKIFEDHKNCFISYGFELLSTDFRPAMKDYEIKCISCQTLYTKSRWSVQQGWSCPICNPRNLPYSKQEKDIVDFIKQLGFDILENKKSLISPYEVDIIIPQKKIGIEYCGLWWHRYKHIVSEKTLNLLKIEYPEYLSIYNKLHKEKGGNTKKEYHKMKMNLCFEKGYRLITIFEDEWVLQKNIVLSRLSNILTKDNNSIFARNCTIKEVTNEECSDFLIKNHIQGVIGSTYKIGLYYEKQLVYLVTFSKPNPAKGSIIPEDDKIFEISRSCGLLNYNINGGFWKCFDYFIKNYEWKKIFTYCDLRWGNGDLYRKGKYKTTEELISPSEFYFGGDKVSRESFFTAAIRENEKEKPTGIPRELDQVYRGYHIIYDCGNLKFTWIK